MESSLKVEIEGDKINGYGLMGPDYDGQLFRWNLWIRIDISNWSSIINPSCMQSAWWTFEWFEKKKKPARQLLLSVRLFSVLQLSPLYGLFSLERFCHWNWTKGWKNRIHEFHELYGTFCHRNSDTLNVPKLKTNRHFALHLSFYRHLTRFVTVKVNEKRLTKYKSKQYEAEKGSRHVKRSQEKTINAKCMCLTGNYPVLWASQSICTSTTCFMVFIIDCRAVVSSSVP